MLARFGFNFIGAISFALLVLMSNIGSAEASVCFLPDNTCGGADASYMPDTDTCDEVSSFYNASSCGNNVIPGLTHCVQSDNGICWSLACIYDSHSKCQNDAQAYSSGNTYKYCEAVSTKAGTCWHITDRHCVESSTDSCAGDNTLSATEISGYSCEPVNCTKTNTTCDPSSGLASTTSETVQMFKCTMASESCKDKGHLGVNETNKCNNTEDFVPVEGIIGSDGQCYQCALKTCNGINAKYNLTCDYTKAEKQVNVNGVTGSDGQCYECVQQTCEEAGYALAGTCGTNIAETPNGVTAKDGACVNCGELKTCSEINSSYKVQGSCGTNYKEDGMVAVGSDGNCVTCSLKTCADIFKPAVGGCDKALYIEENGDNAPSGEQCVICSPKSCSQMNSTWQLAGTCGSGYNEVSMGTSPKDEECVVCEKVLKTCNQMNSSWQKTGSCNSNYIETSVGTAENGDSCVTCKAKTCSQINSSYVAKGSCGEGYDEVDADVTAPDGKACVRCMLKVDEGYKTCAEAGYHDTDFDCASLSVRTVDPDVTPALPGGSLTLTSATSLTSGTITVSEQWDEPIVNVSDKLSCKQCVRKCANGYYATEAAAGCVSPSAAEPVVTPSPINAASLSAEHDQLVANCYKCSSTCTPIGAYDTSAECERLKGADQACFSKSTGAGTCYKPFNYVTVAVRAAGTSSSDCAAQVVLASGGDIPVSREWSDLTVKYTGGGSVTVKIPVEGAVGASYKMQSVVSVIKGVKIDVDTDKCQSKCAYFGSSGAYTCLSNTAYQGLNTTATCEMNVVVGNSYVLHGDYKACASSLIK